MTGPACGNNPNYRMSDGDRQAVDSFRAYLTARAALQRIRTVLETEAVVGRTALEYRGLIAAALMDDAPPAECQTPDYADGPCHCPFCDPAAHPTVPSDRVAILRETADEIADAFGDPMVKHIGILAASWLRHRARQMEAGQTELRRVADETAATEAGPIVQPTRYTVNCLFEDGIDSHVFEITVEYRGGGRWAVLRHGWCLTADGTWDYEMRPSERDDDWLATHRFDLDTALALAKEAAPKVTVNGITVTEALRRANAAGARQDGAQP